MYKKLKAEHMEARKAREEGKLRASLLGGLIGDVDEKVLASRKKAEAADTEFVVPDAIVISTIKNQVKNINKGITEALSVVGEVPAVEDMREKVVALSNLLPPAVEGDDLRMLIQSLEASNMGQAMGKLKVRAEELGFNYDGKEAATLAKEIFV